ncbi:N-acetylmuramoyl-L-alanine amidase [Erwinia mallotivora]|uniref:N-acetylmuramoyl-L-alanine amidase n=1 Tax=Erwinia mallotivora TaxID=69222 RepID=UPI0023EF3874|nr:N-acetylmuramoyl-L-alanine amidase [Erwinia mallotivora]
MQTHGFLSQLNKIQRAGITTLLAIVMSGCATKPATIEARDGYNVNHAIKAVGQDERVRFLVLHYTALDDEKSLKALTQGNVSAHYLILQQPEFKNNQPVVLQLVDENKRAWHAGVSNWNGRNNLNDSSVGIEIVNPGFTDDLDGQRSWYPFNPQQIAAVAALAKDIIHRYQIKPDNVLGHSDIAPLRKQDPGKLFPWEQLAAMGIGAWPDKAIVNGYLAGRAPDQPVEVKRLQALLKQYGYDQIPQHGILDDATRKHFTAFQMRFRPTDISGNADAETEAIIRALIQKYRQA